MSVFHRLAPLMSEVSASCRQTNEHPKVCLSPPLALSSPVVKKKAIQIPSFDEKGLIFEKHDTNLSAADKSSDLTSSKTSAQPSWSKACQYSQRNHGERASTLPRTKPKTHGSQSPSAKPNIYVPTAPKPNSPPTPPTPKSKPRDSLHVPASPWSDFSPLPDWPRPKPSISPTLIVPTPRLTPSPTSICQGTTSDGQSGRQPSPVARERRARSIPISNPKVEPLDEARHDILDERALLDFTHPGFRRVRSLTSKESRQQTEADGLTSATSQDCSFLQSKVGVIKNEYTAKDKPHSPHVEIAAVVKSKPNIRQHKKCQPSEAIDHVEVDHRSSELVSEGLSAQSNPQRTCADYSQKSRYSQASDFTSSHQLHEQRSSGKRAASKMSFFSEPLLGLDSANSESRRRRSDFHKETRGDSSGSHHRRTQEENNIQASILRNPSKFFQLPGESQNIKSSPKYGFLSKTRSRITSMDVRREVSRLDSASKGYSCLSRGVNQEMGISPCARGLNRLQTCAVAPQAQEASHPVSAECTNSHGGFSSKPGLQSQKQSPGQHKSYREVNVSDTGPNQTDISDPPDHHGVPAKLLEQPRLTSVARCPFDTNGFGSSSKGVFEPQQQRVDQRPEQTTAASPQLKYSVTDRAFISEEAEDPYYVTMYYPGSVYVGEYKDIQAAWMTPTEQSQHTHRD